MRNIWKSILRASSFFRKEVVEVVRQPRLILTLILGPFLILFLFGIGYRNEPRTVRTIFVADPSSQLAQAIEKDAPNFSPQLIYEGVIGDENQARQRLAQGQVDMVVVTPPNAYDTIRNNQQAKFTVYHNEIDPAQVGYIDFLAQSYIDEVNRRVLSSIAQQGQSEASSIQGDITSARDSAKAMREALQAGDTAAAQVHQQQYRSRVSALSMAVGASVGLLSGVEQNVGASSSGSNSNSADALSLLNSIQQSPSNSQDIQPGKTDYSKEIQDLQKTENDLSDLQNKLAEFQQISPNVLVRPFTVETQGISRLSLTPMDFFIPAVIVLLLQHISITIASLSIVRERRSGAIELFRVSPVSSLETLIGKYLSYILFTVIIGAILALLLAYGLHAPMLGSWMNFALVALALIFASLGLGFLISLLADTESQAVQFAMIALLLSVFFSGFMLDLRYLWQPVRIISYILPATHAITLLQNIMLRGNPIVQIYMGALLLIGFLLFIISFLILRRRMAQE